MKLTVIKILQELHFTHLCHYNFCNFGNIISEYSENFDVTYDTDTWVINIKSPLDDDILKENSELVMTLTASQTGTDVTGEAALVLKLPKVDSDAVPKFSNAYYIADYPEGGTGDIEFKPSLNFSNIENPEDVHIALDSK